MTSLPADQATRRRDGHPLGEQQDGPRPLDQPGGGTGPPHQGFQFFTLLRGDRNDAMPGAIHQ
jgi:hypothetical protein